ncbi:MAG: hypothetical protein ACWGNK_08040, partial [Desulfobacterales bacterium]
MVNSIQNFEQALGDGEGGLADLLEGDDDTEVKAGLAGMLDAQESMARYGHVVDWRQLTMPNDVDGSVDYAGAEWSVVVGLYD